MMRRLGLGMLLFVVIYSGAEPLQKTGVSYDKKPSGRVYGSDGSVYDKLPTGKVYDTQGKAYGTQASPTPSGNANSMPKPLPRANTRGGRSGGIRGGMPSR